MAETPHPTLQESLASALQASYSPRGSRGKVHDWLMSLSAEDRAAFVEALKNPAIGPTALHQVFKTHGGTVSEAALRGFRKKVVSGEYNDYGDVT